MITELAFVEYLPRADLWASQVVQWWRICLQCRRCKFDPWVGKIPWRRKWHAIPVFLLGKAHGQRSLVGYSPWGCRVGHNLETKQQGQMLLQVFSYDTSRCISSLTIWGVCISILQMRKLRDRYRTLAEVQNYVDKITSNQSWGVNWWLWQCSSTHQSVALHSGPPAKLPEEPGASWSWGAHGLWLAAITCG